VPLQEAAAGAVRTPLLVLMGAAVFVLLIGCANVGNLVLARSIARRREFALRSALGAKAGRLLRQLLAEGAVIGMLAALAGWTLAAVGSEWLAAALSQQFALPAVRLDGSMLVTGALAALLCGVLGGLPAALMVWRSRPGDALQEGGRRLAGGRSEARWQGFLVVSETALSVVLLIGAGLLLRSFLLLEETRLGMDPRQTLTADLLLSKRYADAHRREVFLRELLESVRGLPGVRDAAVYTDPPFLGGGARETFAVEGQPDPGPRQGHAVAFNVVSGGFFRAMGIAMKRGRDFDRRDLERGAPVAIVNEAMARRYWPDTSPIGKRIRLYYDQDPQHWFSIVGVAGDVRYLGREVEPVPQVFVFYQQQPYRSLPYPQAPFVSLAVRTAADPAALMEAVKARIWAVDPNQPVSNAQTMEQALARSGAHRRIYAQFLGVFAAIALVMAIAGIYGLISYAAARRMQEMGIRLALGASAGQILALILRQTLLLTGAGVVLGIAGALALRQGIAALLYGIAATDAPTFAGTAILFAAAAFFAAYVPARRATRVDPMAVLRAE
jgi:predicted permease